MLLITAIAVICFLAFTPRQIPVVSSLNDKFNHILAFFGLAFLSDYSFRNLEFGWEKMLPLLLYGVGIEVVQSFLSLRFFSFWDIAADLVGLIGYLAVYPLLKRLPVLKERF